MTAAQMAERIEADWDASKETLEDFISRRFPNQDADMRRAALALCAERFNAAELNREAWQP